LLALVALMAALPLIIAGPTTTAVLSLFTGAVLVASIHAARPGRRAVAIGLGLALADFAIGRWAAVSDSRWQLLMQLAMWIATLLYVIATLMDAIFASGVVTVETLQASLCVYLLIGLLGAFGFTLIETLLPGSFRATVGPILDGPAARARVTLFMRLFVLSYATLSGSGYAPIAPATGFASNVVALEGMTG
jgi:hypothetical protein